MFSVMNVFSRSVLLLILYLGRRYRNGYYVRELAREVGIGVGSASESLRFLEEVGFVSVEERGRLRIYKADMGSFLLQEFKVLFTLLELNPLISCLKDESSLIILFGSCAVGEDTVDSDIDIFIEAKNKKLVAETIDSFQKKSERQVSPLIMNSYEFRELKAKDKPLYERIINGKIIHEV